MGLGTRRLSLRKFVAESRHFFGVLRIMELARGIASWALLPLVGVARMGSPKNSNVAPESALAPERKSPASSVAREGDRLDYQVVPTRLSAIKPNARNARTHSKKQIAQIAASIREFGFTSPVLTDETGVLIAGHGRIEAGAPS
jgi:hypothetical protein